MAALHQFFRALGEAICNNGLKALAGLVPLGSVIYDVAEDACQRLRESEQDDQLHHLLASAVEADPSKIQAEAKAVAAELASDQTPEVRDRLAGYLAQIPAVARRSLRRPSDPQGRSVPASFTFRRAEDLLQILPANLPRFQAGDQPPGQGDWALRELLGVGGFGEVWKATHRFFDGISPVALKFCLDPTARERLLGHEAAVLNQLMRKGRHPGIVPLLDASLSTDPPCLKYEYIEGGDLAGLIRDWPESDIPRIRQASELLLELARIVAFAHRLDPPIIHRDLKPANVLLDIENAPPKGFHLKITDFGIGGVAAQQALAEVRNGTTSREKFFTASVQGAHTPLYASPQQIRGDKPDPRDDVHALGVIWYQMLTGDLTSGAPTGLWTDELEEQGLSRDLIRLLGSCVASRVEKRPADAGVLADQLESLLKPEEKPTIVKPVSKPVPPPSPPVTTREPEDRLQRFLQGGQPGALLWQLDLTNRRIGDAGAIALANYPRLANLSTLILSGCDIGDEGIIALAQSPHILNVTRLDLWDNRISDRGLIALAECSYLENLTQLDLGRNRISDEGIKALASSPHFARLSELLLVSNHIGDDGALAIANSSTLANLAWLKPLDNRITARGADALKRTFGKRVRIM